MLRHTSPDMRIMRTNSIACPPPHHHHQHTLTHAHDTHDTRECVSALWHTHANTHRHARKRSTSVIERTSC
jgi:hypothetical protein